VTSLPVEKSGAFEGQFGFVVADGHLDLPATSVGKDNPPGKLRCVSGLGSEEIPGRLVFASSDHEPERLVVGGVRHWKGNDPGSAFALMASIPEHTVVPGAFALGDLTRCASLFLFIKEMVGFGPAQDKAGTPHKDLCQPGIACKAAIPDVQDFLAPQLVDLIEDFGFFRACLTGSLAPGRPPMQMRQGGWSFVPENQHLQPMKTGHKDRSSTRWIVVAWFDPL